MISILKQDQSASRKVYKYVPMQNFKANSDIKWTNPDDVDKQLYKKYKLNKDDIEFIEKNIEKMPATLLE